MQLTGNQLKVIALVSMTLDHIGVIFFPGAVVLRILGRLAFPIFAYMIAEGCFYTHDRKRYLLGIVGLGLLCQVAYWIAAESLEQSILTSFALSIITIYALDAAWKRRDLYGFAALIGALALDFVACLVLPVVLFSFYFSIDYGFFGVMIAPLCYLPRLVCPEGPVRYRWTLAACALGLALTSVELTMGVGVGAIQWFSLATLALLAFYRGKRGTWHMKYLFYIYYPAHLAVLYLIAQVIYI